MRDTYNGNAQIFGCAKCVDAFVAKRGDLCKACLRIERSALKSARTIRRLASGGSLTTAQAVGVHSAALAGLRDRDLRAERLRLAAQHDANMQRWRDDTFAAGYARMPHLGDDALEPVELREYEDPINSVRPALRVAAFVVVAGVAYFACAIVAQWWR